MTQHVLLISLGPVQSFIVSARRCRDLWFGSWVLSELAKAAAAGVIDVLGGGDDALGALVFPAPTERAALAEGSPTSVANKLVVRVPGGEERVREVAEQGRERMRTRLRALHGQAFARVGRDDPRRARHLFAETAAAQVDELFEYLWVAVPEDEDDGGYARARAEAERLLAARKNTRAWAQPSWGREGVPKSSLDGIRESVIHEDLYDRPVTGAPRKPALTPEQRRAWYGVHGSERLCGVGLFKRWGVQLDAAERRSIERFFSTAHLAALPLMLGIAADVERRPELEIAWRELCDAAGPARDELDVVPGRGTGLFGRTDGAILFAQRLAETLEELGHDRESAVTRNALEKQKTFLRVAGRGEPLRYYAILVADGDGMGGHIDGLPTPEAHRALSRSLDGFAQSARGIVEAHDGRLVYSGGDDVLAFLPLHRAIVCAQAIAARFAEAVPGATLSAGLAVVHYVDPMGAALELARDAEQEAKRVPGKHALAVALDKRSGGTTVVCDHWGALSPRLLHLAALHAAEAIPDKAGHELADLARLAERAEHDALPGLRAVQKSEALRILGRKRAGRGKEDLARETRAWLASHLGDDPAVLGREMAIAGLIHEAETQAAVRAGEGA
jgi:CRISPR-associated protein Cmr2